MCLYQVFKDIKTAIISPPKGPLDREILNSRLRTYWVRVQYMAWNILATAAAYSFTDSLLNEYLNNQQFVYIIIFHSIQAIAIIAYFITSCKNPGYIEKVKWKQFRTDSIVIDIDQKDPSTPNDDKDYKYLDMNLDFDVNKNHELLESNSNNKAEENIDFNFPYSIVRYVPEYNHDIKIDPDAAPTNFCWRCKFIRPIRSKHCYDCDRCVGKFDHHCPMVGNCVAANNHRYFVLFMSAQTTVVLWTFYISLNTLFQMNTISMTQDDVVNQRTMHIERGPFGWFLRIVFFVAIFFAVFVTVGLSGYHIYLALSNQTTYEMIKPQMVESYIKDELKRKKKFIKKQQKQKLKELKQSKLREIEREKELKRQQRELQRQIDELARYNDDEWERDEEDDKKYNSEIDESKDDDNNDTDSGSSSDDTSDDLATLSEKVLLFDSDRQKKSKLKRSATPKHYKTKHGKNERKHNRNTVNYTDAYRNYFDEGFCRNMYLFLTGSYYPEFMTPLPCTVIKKPSSR